MPLPRIFVIVVAASAVTLFCAACAEGPEERRARVYSLQADPDPANVEQIREMLSDPDRDVRATALNTLVSLRVHDAEDIAVNALADDDAFVRSMAAKLLGDLEAIGRVRLLAERLRGDGDPWVRQRSAEALARIGGEEAVNALIIGLQDPLKEVRLASVRGIASHGPSLATEQLVRVLGEDVEWELRVQAARGLGRSGDAMVEGPLRTALDDPNEFVRAAAANALETLLGEKAGTVSLPAGSGLPGVPLEEPPPGNQ